MPRRRTPEQFQQQIEVTLPELAGRYEGEAIFAPSASDLAYSLGVTRGMLYHGGTTYEQKLETATGLSVLHNGLVLGHKERLEPPATIPKHIETIASQIDSLTDEDKARLMARIAISEVRKP